MMEALEKSTGYNDSTTCLNKNLYKSGQTTDKRLVYEKILVTVILKQLNLYVASGIEESSLKSVDGKRSSTSVPIDNCLQTDAGISTCGPVII